MSLSADQTAMLQMLLERDQSYADLADLLGLDEAEVRTRSRAALAELGGDDPDREAGISDYLLGQADPIGRAEAARRLGEDPADLALASRIVDRLATITPGAKLPILPDQESPGRFARRPVRTRPDTLPGAGLQPKQVRMIGLLGGGAVVLIAIVLALSGAFSAGDEPATPTAASDADSSTTASDVSTGQDAQGRELERLTLRSSTGDATGTATFGLATGDQPYVDLKITGLDPAPTGKVYVLWLLVKKGIGFPLTPLVMDPKGGFSDRFSIPTAIVQLVARVRFVDVSIAPVATVQKVVAKASKAGTPLLAKPGETVLTGSVPVGGSRSGG